MNKDINDLKIEIEEYKIITDEDLEQFTKIYESKNSRINKLFSLIPSMTELERRDFGCLINDLKSKIKNKIKDYKVNKNVESITENNDVDLHKPLNLNIGREHVISTLINKMESVLNELGFLTIQGREIEDDWHNFEALNFAKDHPARDMQDTFYVDKIAKYILRTQTSSEQIRVMEKFKPPLRIVSYGKCYRSEDISMRSHCFFNQIEILYVDKEVSLVDLKSTISIFVKKIFGNDTSIRFRSSYFPFTEPSIEVDISCTICKKLGCKICKQSGWVELGGAGMVDPQVLNNCKINSEEYNGFAWGFGIERAAMLIHQIDDIRLLSENDVRFLKQF